jgi:hypothetical protein
MPTVGIVDADALSNSEKLSPVAPSTFTAVALVVRFCFEVCLTRDMVASSVSSCEIAWQACARRTGAASVTIAIKRETFQSSSIHLHEFVRCIVPRPDETVREQRRVSAPRQCVGVEARVRSVLI